MEKDIPIGTVADFDVKLSGGKATLELSVPAAALTNTTVVDAGTLIDKLFLAIEKASPAGVVPIEESVKAIVKAAVAAL